MLLSAATSQSSGGVVAAWTASGIGVGEESICRVTTHDNTTAARLSSSGEAIVSCGVDVALCATRDATVALRLQTEEGAPRGLLQCCDFDQSSRLVCVGGEGGLLDVWAADGMFQWSHRPRQ